MLKKYLWVKNFVFLCSFSLLSAQIFNRVIVGSLPDTDLPERRPMFPHAQHHRNRAERRSLPHYKIISERNIFNSEYVAPSDEKKPQANADAAAPPQKTELNVLLIGTVVGVPKDSFAIVQDQRTRKQELFQIDDIIQDVARVTRIDRCKVMVLRDGQEEFLECPEDAKDTGSPRRSAQPSAPPGAAGADSVKKVSEDEFLIDESEVENALNNINQLMTQIRVVPNFQDGQTNGFKVFAIKPDSIFSKIGLLNGDVIQRINDQEITTPDKAFQAFNVLRSEKNLSVEILRRGAKRSLSYEIR